MGNGCCGMLLNPQEQTPVSKMLRHAACRWCLVLPEIEAIGVAGATGHKIVTATPPRCGSLSGKGGPRGGSTLLGVDIQLQGTDAVIEKLVQDALATGIAENHQGGVVVQSWVGHVLEQLRSAKYARNEATTEQLQTNKW